MKVLQGVVFAMGLAAIGAQAADPKVPEATHKALQPWKPVSVTATVDQLQVILPQDRVTEQTFASVVSALCDSVRGAKPHWPALARKEAVVLNRHRKQGYVLDGGLVETCAEEGEVTAGDRPLFLAARTRLF